MYYSMCTYIYMYIYISPIHPYSVPNTSPLYSVVAILSFTILQYIYISPLLLVTDPAEKPVGFRNSYFRFPARCSARCWQLRVFR